MAEPSRAGWHDWPPEKRFCAHCGDKLTLTTQGGLWLSESTEEVFHARCRAKAWKAASCEGLESCG